MSPPAPTVFFATSIHPLAVSACRAHAASHCCQEVLSKDQGCRGPWVATGPAATLKKHTISHILPCCLSRNPIFWSEVRAGVSLPPFSSSPGKTGLAPASLPPRPRCGGDSRATLSPRPACCLQGGLPLPVSPSPSPSRLPPPAAAAARRAAPPRRSSCRRHCSTGCAAAPGSIPPLLRPVTLGGTCGRLLAPSLLPSFPPSLPLAV